MKQKLFLWHLGHKYRRFTRSSRPEVFCKKGVLRNCRAKTCKFLKQETLAQVFSVNFAKFPRTPFLIEHLRWLLPFHIRSGYNFVADNTGISILSI